MKLQKKNDQFFLTLPKKILEGMGWDKGDKIEVKIDGKNAIRLVKV